ncbi:MAG: BatA domain-containing protein, partial [Pirellulales bacterium]
MFRDVSLLAFGFGNLLILGWLAAAAVPILIHLWNKRRYREVSWAAIEYLLAAMRKNSRRMRIEQLLLLAVRTLIIALLVFAVAQPYLEQAGLPFAPGQRTLKVLVIDGSYSMGYKPTDKSR